MTKVIIGTADQSLATELRRMLSEVGGANVTSFAETTHDLSALVAREKPDVVVLHDQLGPQRTIDVIRDLANRSPATGVLVVNSDGGMDGALAAMEEGARGVLTHPLQATDVYDKYESAKRWSSRMRDLISGAATDTAQELGRHGRVTLVAGAKGGVGTTTIATHLAIDLRRKVPGARICLVDLDLQGGDISGILEARQRVSIADVARVSEDLDGATIMDALVEHESGISLLLAPLQVHETELVTSMAIRAVITLLRQQFHAVIIDGGSHPTPAQAAAVELADEIVTVVTPDVLALRSYRRLIQAWDSLGVRDEHEIHLLLNKVTKADIVTHDAISKLTSAQMVETQLPSALRWLERGVNARNPEQVNEAAWWKGIEKVGVEVGIHPTQGEAPAQAPTPTNRAKPRGRRGRRGKPNQPARTASESGQIAIETVALVPVVALICLMVWQLCLTGLAFVWNGHAANAAARAQAIGGDPVQAARAAMPDSMRDQVRVRVRSDGTVQVSTRIPVICTGCASLPNEITQSARVTEEP